MHVSVQMFPNIFIFLNKTKWNDTIKMYKIYKEQATVL